MKSSVAAPRFDSLEQEVFLSLWRTYDRLRQIEEDLFDRYGLTAQQYNVLRLLRAAHPAKLATLDLGRRLISRAPDITRMIDRLEQLGLVCRERLADNRRVVHVGITSAGRTLVADMAQPLRACHRRQLGHLSAADLKRLGALLRRARAPHEEEGGVWQSVG
ncbi:MAG: MarR family transcriptional regulator [Gemmataceae bacterium]